MYMVIFSDDQYWTHQCNVECHQKSFFMSLPKLIILSNYGHEPNTIVKHAFLPLQLRNSYCLSSACLKKDFKAVDSKCIVIIVGRPGMLVRRDKMKIIFLVIPIPLWEVCFYFSKWRKIHTILYSNSLTLWMVTPQHFNLHRIANISHFTH